ncbi:hypothetical protein GCM10020331_033710 [Ectobacillus funiculus]
MNILITGGAGFIGSHLALRLLQDGKKVVLLDSFHPHYSRERKQYHIEQVQQHGAVSFFMSAMCCIKKI